MPGVNGANSWTTPPLSTASMASSKAPGEPAHTSTTSGRIPMAWRTAPAVASAGSAPERAAAARRAASGSATTISRHPRARAACTCSSPICPAPTTSRRVCGPTLARRWARTQQASGSTSVAASVDTCSGTGRRSRRAFSAGTRTCSAKPPGWIRVCLKTSQSVWWPRRHRSHTRHGTWWWTATRVPSARSQPAGRGSPSATTSPTSSCPSTTGALRDTYQSSRSLPQTPQASIRTTTSPGPGGGRVRSSMRTSPGA